MSTPAFQTRPSLSSPVPGLPCLLEPVCPEEALRKNRQTKALHTEELVLPPLGSQVGFMSLVGRRQCLVQDITSLA